MRSVLTRLQPPLNHSVVRAKLCLTPFHSLEIERDAMDHVIVRQQFEFSAAHRLHVPSLSDEKNREVFGKCNNPSGHGHNYKLEVAVRAPIRADGQTLAVETLDALVDDAVIQKLDHKHLNADVPQFATLNPSVENIARVIFEMLESRVRDIGVELDAVSVWETGKTVCTYRGKQAQSAR
jgi:6-pyruvoyltetrahydropterin/6-carboxytetrahydropterin synthase